MSTDAVVSIALGAWLGASFPFAALVGTALRRSSRADAAHIAARPAAGAAGRPPGHQV